MYSLRVVVLILVEGWVGGGTGATGGDRSSGAGERAQQIQAVLTITAVIQLQGAFVDI